MQLSIATEQAGSDAYVIALGGELDLYSCPEFKDELLRVIAERARHIVIDLAATTFIDSTALGVLLRGVQRLRETSDGVLSVACVDPNICKVFEVTGLDRVFSVYTSREEALAQVPSP
ncbi:MAG: STAS domain-containing protein [Gaiellales bacterium]